MKGHLLLLSILGATIRTANAAVTESAKAYVNELINEKSHKEANNEVCMDKPCSNVYCSLGRVCEANERGEAECNCVKECPPEPDSRRKVCTQNNETWTSDCEVYRQRCLCADNSELCRRPEYQNMLVIYYGACREIPKCSESEMSDFPRRMRDWLFTIMRDIAGQRALSPDSQNLDREAEAYPVRGIHAAIWKWCDLATHDEHKYMSHHELFPIRASLMALEHCIAPFLDLCDDDNDHRITLAEFGKCLQLHENELVDTCEELTDDALVDWRFPRSTTL